MSEFLWKKHLLQWLPAKTDMSLYICSVSSVFVFLRTQQKEGDEEKN